MFLRPFQWCAQNIPACLHAVPAYLSGVLKFIESSYILHQVCTVFCCQVRPKFRLRIRVPGPVGLARGVGGKGGGGGEIHSQRIVGIGSETFFGDNVIRRAVVTRRVVKLIVKIGSIVRFQLLAPEGPMLAYLHLYLGTELAFRTVTQTGRVIESI